VKGRHPVVTSTQDPTEEPTDDEQVHYEVVDGVAVLTLSRPERMNAFTAAMGRQITECIDRSDQDDSVRAVIVTGAGRAFCAGADLARGGATFDYGEREGDVPHRDGGGVVSLRLFRSLKPVIAAVNGAAVGVGVTMTLPMDYRMAAETARFGFVFTRRGIVPEACSTWFLPRLVGITRALEWVTSGRLFPAAEALSGGLVQEVHPPEQLLDRAHDFAHSLAAETSAVSVALSRRMLWEGLAAPGPETVHQVESRAMFSRGGMADIREGVEAFLAHRPAEFPDRVSEVVPGLLAELGLDGGAFD